MQQISATALQSEPQHGVLHKPGTALFSAENVTVKYGNSVVLDELSFVLNSGQQVAIVGPNGAGKSTLFRLMAGEIRPNRGRVSLFGSTPEKHICVAYVPQNKAIDWKFPLSVSDFVMMGRIGKIGFFRRPSRIDRSFVQESLAEVNAEHLANKQIGELSGGQQQRIFIARALAQEAELLLFDEPLTGLDVPSQQNLLQILEKVTKGGMTSVVATHDLSLAASHFDLVLLLNKRLLAIGDVDSTLSAENLQQLFSANQPK